MLERPWEASGFACELVGIEGCDKREGGIFEHIPEDKGRSSHFCQLDSIVDLHGIHLKVVRSVGIRVRSQPPTWTGAGDQCQVGNQ